MVLVLALLVTTTGCYFGRTKTTKTAGYVANGTAVVLGGAMLAAVASEGSCSGDASCAGAGIGAAGAALLGLTTVAIGGVGLLINAVVPLKTEPILVSPPATGSATVTTPGLPATQIDLR